MSREPLALELRQLRVFVTLVDRGSMSAAAQELGLAQSTVSESVSALERSLGAAVILRRRGGREVALTPAGEALLPHARQVVAVLEAARLAVAGANASVSATVEIVANESVSTYVLAAVLRSLRGDWPRTHFAVSVATCPGVRDGVEGGTYDLGVLLETDGPPARPASMRGALSDRVVLATDVPLVLFGARGHPLMPASRRTALSPDELTGHPLFISDAAGDFHTLVTRFFERHGLPGPFVDAAGSVEGVKRGVLDDRRALGLLPGYAIAEELSRGTLTATTLAPALPRMRLEAVLSGTRPRHPAVEGVLEGIRAMMA